MGHGIDECDVYADDEDDDEEGGWFGLVTSKDCGIHDPRGDVAWVVGITSETDSPVYLGWWFIVKSVERSPDPNFLFQFVGEKGGVCNPMPVISDEPWFSQLLGVTGNFEFGLTEIRRRDSDILAGLRAAAACAGCPQV
jgi:hypothetical protein